MRFALLGGHRRRYGGGDRGGGGGGGAGAGAGGGGGGGAGAGGGPGAGAGGGGGGGLGATGAVLLRIYFLSKQQSKQLSRARKYAIYYSTIT